MLGEGEHGRAVLRKCRERLFVVRGMRWRWPVRTRTGRRDDRGRETRRAPPRNLQARATPRPASISPEDSRACEAPPKGLDRRRAVGDDTEVVFPAGVPGIKQRRTAVTEACTPPAARCACSTMRDGLQRQRCQGLPWHRPPRSRWIDESREEKMMWKPQGGGGGASEDRQPVSTINCAGRDVLPLHWLRRCKKSCLPKQSLSVRCAGPTGQSRGSPGRSAVTVDAYHGDDGGDRRTSTGYVCGTTWRRARNLVDRIATARARGSAVQRREFCWA